jgi:cytochrome c oxidase subunit II
MVTTRLLQRQGPAAERIAELWWLFVAMGAAVYVLVIVLLVVPMIHRRRRAVQESSGDDLTDVPTGLANGWIIGFGVVLPLVLLIVALVASVSTMRALPRTAPPGSVVIDVVGYQFWWSASYRAEQVTVANEIHVPVGERVELRLTSADVIHSFWVPGLQGKLDVLPDGTNTLVIEADEAGVYGGECAEFCGLQHANMGMLVIAQPRLEFDAWVTAQQQPAAAPASETARRGQQVFEDRDCAQCHTIRGVATGGQTAPDLTHVASRRTLLSDTVENTTSNLTAFLRDPDAVKVGTGMPQPELSESDLRNLIAYLEGLE